MLHAIRKGMPLAAFGFPATMDGQEQHGVGSCPSQQETPRNWNSCVNWLLDGLAKGAVLSGCGVVAHYTKYRLGSRITMRR